MAQIKNISNQNNSILYLTDYGNVVVATIFAGVKHNSYIVDGTDICLGQINGETFHFNLNNGQNEVYGHHSDGKVRTLSRREQNIVLSILLAKN